MIKMKSENNFNTINLI